jgi:hypothetical protein
MILERGFHNVWRRCIIGQKASIFVEALVDDPTNDGLGYDDMMMVGSSSMLLVLLFLHPTIELRQRRWCQIVKGSFQGQGISRVNGSESQGSNRWCLHSCSMLINKLSSSIGVTDTINSRSSSSIIPTTISVLLDLGWMQLV